MLIVLFLMSILDARVRVWQWDSPATQRLEVMRNQVQRLDLTDLSLFTGARYIRHLSQTDRHTPFQDHPLAFEHFPSGSLIMPPTSFWSTP